MIVIINGPLDIGKIETSWELLRLYEQADMLDGDHIGAVQSFEIYDEVRIEHLYQTTRLLIVHHRSKIGKDLQPRCHPKLYINQSYGI